MNMQSGSKRRWLQLHLSTCILMTLVAGVLVGLNLSPRHEQYYKGWVEWTERLSYGWPFTACQQTVYFSDSEPAPPSMPGELAWEFGGLCMNLLEALLLLFLTAYLGERLVTRLFKKQAAG